MGPRAGLAFAAVLQGPGLEVEVHADAAAADRAVQQNLVLPRHLGVVGIRVTRLRLLRDVVRRVVVAHEEPDPERLAAEALLLPYDLGACHRIGESLRLLQRQQSQRESAPRRYPVRLAAQ